MSVWDEVVGQQQVVDTFDRVARSLAGVRSSEPGSAEAEPRSSMTHAWLVTGPPGSGRSVAARAFAAALLCEDGHGCGVCDGCRGVRGGTHPDLHVIRTEKVVFAIDEIRPLVLAAQRAPTRGRWRIMLMEDADRMVERTSTVLLKAIEEPPARTVWLLCAPSPQDVMTTIRSRCRMVSLRVPPVQDVADLLVRRDGIDPERALVAAHAAQSHVGMARRLATNAEAAQRRRSLLSVPSRIRGVGDAVMAAAELVELAQSESRAAAEERDAAEKADLLRTIGAEGVTRLPPALRAQVRQLEEDQKRRATRAQRDVLDRAMVDLLSLYRDVLVVQFGAPVDPVNVDLIDQVRAIAHDSAPEQTLRRIDAVTTARRRLAANVAPLLATEAMMIALRPQG